jgi:hypothetical protein
MARFAVLASRRSNPGWVWLFAALVAALLAFPSLSWGGVIVIDDFDDDNYSDDGLFFDDRTIDHDPNTQVAISGGALGILDFESNSSGYVTLTYSTNSTGVDLTATDGFRLDGVFLGPGDQTLTWEWTARDNSNAIQATATGVWTVGDDPLFMDPDGAGDYTDWKTLEVEFRWVLGDGDVVSISATSLVAVPEPTTVLLFACGLLGLAAAGRRRSAR